MFRLLFRQFNTIKLQETQMVFPVSKFTLEKKEYDVEMDKWVLDPDSAAASNTVSNSFKVDHEPT